MSYSIIFTNTFRKSLKKIDRKQQQIIKDYILNLKEDPYPHIEKNKNPNLPTWRTRKGTYRCLLEVNQNTKEIVMMLVAHRKDVYNVK